MKGICPICEKERQLESISSVETFLVRGEPIEVDVRYLKCNDCGNSFDDPDSTYDPLEIAYREYRKSNDITQPEEIKDFRKKYGLTQGEMSQILGWGIATLNRYENGALQSDANEKTLRLAMKPENLLRLIEETPEALNADKRKRLIEELQLEEEKSLSFERVIEIQSGRYEPNEFSGFKKFNLVKLFNAILFFCREGGTLKTKLNKLLFYADFKHFKEYTVSITGAHYAHVPFGPAPDDFNSHFATLIRNNSLKVEEKIYSPDVVGENLVSVKEPNLSVFSDSELKILASVKEFFKDYNAGEITKYSHEEEGYKETADGDIISYEYASVLKI